jgi:hypothetical protein
MDTLQAMWEFASHPYILTPTVVIYGAIGVVALGDRRRNKES